MTTFDQPPDYPRIKVVGSFAELEATPFSQGINALCWPRSLAGDFGEVVDLLGPGEGIVQLDEARLRGIRASAAGRAAIEVLLEDQHLLRERDLDPALNCIHQYPRDENTGPVPTHVFSFHVDSASVRAETWLCTYFGAPSEGLRNDQALRRVEHPETRAQLLSVYGGKDDAGFEQFLAEHHFDLHYAAAANAIPFSFGTGHLWRIALDWPGSQVPPCIHRAPAEPPGHCPRLLLIS